MDISFHNLKLLILVHFISVAVYRIIQESAQGLLKTRQNV
jgi:hypothetical protein